jgi:hypothetical protein
MFSHLTAGSRPRLTQIPPLRGWVGWFMEFVPPQISFSSSETVLKAIPFKAAAKSEFR